MADHPSVYDGVGDVDKGDGLHSYIRSRLAASDIREAHESAVFAPLPPLDALRNVFSPAVTTLPGVGVKNRDPHSGDRIQLSLVDISRA